VYYYQSEYEIRCEWGLVGITQLGPASDVVVVVDVLSFSTCVDVAVSRGAIVYPYRWNDGSAVEYAGQVGAVVAQSRRSSTGYTLSPSSLVGIEPGTKLVLPSPNGSTLSLSVDDTPVLAGCLRNAKAVASAAQRLGRRILVVPAGERWPDGTLRPCIEDIVGAGAIIYHIAGRKSPEAKIAEAAYHAVVGGLFAELISCSSGKELVERGYRQDVELAAQLNVSDCAPLMVDGAYRCEIVSTVSDPGSRR
jgi:2-phosphosulfolactate phosphatase